MNITSCPQCGGHVRAISIGWKCESCQGFIDMRGEFHPHKEEPFIPLMTNADRIRAMNDEELGIFLYRYFWGREANMPIARHRMVDWLQQPAEEDT